MADSARVAASPDAETLPFRVYREPAEGPAEGAAGADSRAWRVNLLVQVVGAGMVLALAYGFFATEYLGQGWPYNSFLCFRPAVFSDFYNTNVHAHGLDPYTKRSCYPPFAIVLARAFACGFDYTEHGALAARASLAGQLSFALLALPFGAFFFLAVYRGIRTGRRARDLTNALVLTASYPVVFLIDRGNYVMIAFMLLFGFVHFYRSRPALANLLLALAVSLKLYPLLFLLLPAAERRWRDCAAVVGLAAALSLGPLFFFEGGFAVNLELFRRNLSLFNTGQPLVIHNVAWTLDFANLVRVPTVLLAPDTPSGPLPYYPVLCLAVLGCAALALLREREFWKKVLLLTIASICLPSRSADYNLVYLFIPLLVYFREAGAPRREDYFYLVCAGLLLVPKSYGLLRIAPIHWDRVLSPQAFLNPLLLLALFVKLVAPHFRRKPAPRQGASGPGGPRGHDAQPSLWRPRIWAGCDLPAWLRLLARNGFAVHPRYWHLALGITAAGVGHTILRLLQSAWYGGHIARTPITHAPLFIVGHWRTGTTLLHELLVLDDRHAYPTAYQCFEPNHFLLTEGLVRRWLGFALPARRGTDNMAFGWDHPQEDEFALCLLGQPSPYAALAFPNRARPDVALATLEALSARARERWKRAFVGFLRHLTFRHGPRRLVLKSPTHSFRIPTLLELFPDARFVHIVRDPYAVFPSALNLWRTLYRTHGLQSLNDRGLEEYVFTTFARLYELIEGGKRLIEPGRFHELRYEDLLADPVGQMGLLYEALGLGGFEAVRPRVEAYFREHADYRTNRYTALSPEQRDEIRRRWGPVLERYGYAPPPAADRAYRDAA